MNKKYIYVNGKIKIFDKNNLTRYSEYYDNIEQVLIKENVIETIEIEQKKLAKEKKYHKNISFNLFLKSIISLSAIPIILIILPIVLGNTCLNSIPNLLYLFGISMPTFLTIFQIYEYNQLNRINKGIDNQLEFLKQELIIENEKLNGLKKTHSEEKIIISVSKRVDDINELQRLKEMLVLYYNCGYYQDKYNKYLEKGNLENKLIKCYSEDEISLIKETLIKQKIKL